MKKITLAFLIVLIAQCSFAQEFINRKSLCDYNLNGKVKSIKYNDVTTRKITTFNQDGIELTKEIINSSSDDYFENKHVEVNYVDTLTEISIYNMENNLIWVSEIIMDAQRRIKNESWKNNITNEEFNSDYIYSKDGILLSEMICRPIFDEIVNVERYAIRYFYDNDGVLIKLERTDYVSDKMIAEDYLYSKTGKIREKKISQKNFSSENAITHRVKYDKSANELERIAISELDKSEKTESKIRYNKNSGIKKIRLYDSKGKGCNIRNKYYGENLKWSQLKLADGTKQYVLTNTYDENGNLLSTTMINFSNPTLNSETYYEYKYDDRGNWISRSRIQDGQIQNTEEREIIYY
jgi:hypothetical protein